MDRSQEWDPFGAITFTSSAIGTGTPRQMQLMLRLTFWARMAGNYNTMENTANEDNS